MRRATRPVKLPGDTVGSCSDTGYGALAIRALALRAAAPGALPQDETKNAANPALWTYGGRLGSVTFTERCGKYWWAMRDYKLSIDGDRRGRSRRSRTRLSPLLRQPGRRASGPAQRCRSDGRNCQCDQRQGPAPDPLLPLAGVEEPDRRRLFRPARRPHSRPRASCISASSITTTQRATSPASPPPVAMRVSMASLLNAAWPAATQRACPPSSLLRDGGDP